MPERTSCPRRGLTTHALHELVDVDLDVEDVLHRAAEANGVTELDAQVATRHVDSDVVTHQSASVCHRGCRARTGPAAQRLADAALPHAHGDLVGTGDGDELDVGVLREALVDLELRARGGDVRGLRVVDEQHEMRVAHPGGVPFVRDTVVRRFEAERARCRERDGGGVERRGAHVDGRGDHLARVVELQVDRTTTTVGVDDEALPVTDSLPVHDPREAADAIPAHLRDVAVGVEQLHPAVGAVGAGAHDDEAVGADAAMAVAERDGLIRQDPLHARVGIEPRPDEEVVPRGVQLREADRAHAPQIARSVGRSVHGLSEVPNQVMRGSRRNHMRWRRANRRVRATAASSAASSEGSRPSRWSSTSL